MVDFNLTYQYFRCEWSKHAEDREQQEDKNMTPDLNPELR